MSHGRFQPRDPVLVAAFAVAWAAALVPIWAARVLPLGGWYEQLALAQLWRHLADPAWHLDRFYVRALAPVPGWMHTGILRALASLFPVDVAGRIWLSAYALALPVGAARLAGAFGRSRWLALFAFPLVWNMQLATGQVGFAAGLALLTFAVAELELFVRRPSRGHLVAVVLLGCALWLTDAAAWAFFALSSLILCLPSTSRLRRSAQDERSARGLLLVLPSVALAIAGARWLPAGGAESVSPPPLQRLGEVSSSLVLTWTGDAPYRLLLVLLGVWLFLLLTARTDEADSAAGGLRLEALALLSLVLALALPAALHRPIELPAAAARFWPLCALLLALLPHGALAGRRRLLFLPVLVVAILYPVGILRATASLEKPLQGARKLAAHLDRGASTLTVAPTADEELPFGPRIRLLGQAHAFPVLAAGGFDPDLPMAPPLVLTRVLPTPPDRTALDPDALSGYDYLLTLGERFAYERLGPDAQARFPLEATDGNWRLYARRR